MYMCGLHIQIQPLFILVIFKQMRCVTNDILSTKFVHSCMMSLCVYTTDRDRVGIKRYDALYCYIMTIDGMMNDDLRRYDTTIRSIA